MPSFYPKPDYPTREPTIQDFNQQASVWGPVTFLSREKSLGSEANVREIQAALFKGNPEKNGVCIQSPVPCIKRFGDMIETIFYSQCGSSADVKEHAGTCINSPCKMLISQKRGL